MEGFGWHMAVACVCFVVIGASFGAMDALVGQQAREAEALAAELAELRDRCPCECGVQR